MALYLPNSNYFNLNKYMYVKSLRGKSLYSYFALLIFYNFYFILCYNYKGRGGYT